MLQVSDIQQYFKSGKGKTFQFYITDEELQEILLKVLPEDLKPYTLISYRYDGDKTFYFQEVTVEKFIDLRNDGYDRFYLRSHKLTPVLDFPAEPVTEGKVRSDYEKYYLYNGLIDIQHGFKLEHKYFFQSSIGLIDKFYHKNNPDTVYENDQYVDVFKQLKKNITRLLKFKSKETWLDGRVSIPGKNNVSEGFFDAVKENKITVKFEIV